MLVDLLGRYSNSPHFLETLSTLLNLPDAVKREARSAPRQHQMRLSKVYQTQLVEAYSAGRSVYELAEQFAVTRQTAAAILKRHGVKTRYKLLTEANLATAKKLYKSGASYAMIGERFKVNPSTVRKALLGAGVESRPVGTNQWSETLRSS